MKKEIHVCMQDFVALFNKALRQTPMTSIPNGENQKGLFLTAMPPDIDFPLKRANPQMLVASQNISIELEDDLIIYIKCKKDVQIPNYQASTSSSSNDVLVQKLANDLLVVKKKLPKASFTYQDIPRKFPIQNAPFQGRQFTLYPSQKSVGI